MNFRELELILVNHDILRTTHGLKFIYNLNVKLSVLYMHQTSHLLTYLLLQTPFFGTILELIVKIMFRLSI